MRFQSYFNTALFILQQYDGRMPLLHFLKQYFSQHKKHGSKDRKWISHLCYNYYRLGHVLPELVIEERLRVAIFLCNDTAADWKILYAQHWVANWNSQLKLRIAFIKNAYPTFTIASIFPWIDELSEGIEQTDFILAHFIQPNLFLRIRPGKQNITLQKLSDQQIPFQKISPTCLSLPNASKIDTILCLDNEVVVQDYSSQRIQEFLQLIRLNKKVPMLIWDGCAASGGKSILAYDTFPNSLLTVSDIRPAILQNLKERFRVAGINPYQSFIADLSQSNAKQKMTGFQLVISDVPCTGSGTWTRTPEQFYFFSKNEIGAHATLQKKILKNMLPHLASDGYLLYITCSVFKKENEEMVAYILAQSKLRLVKMEILKGYDQKADTLFAALFSQESIRLAE